MSDNKDKKPEDKPVKPAEPQKPPPPLRTSDESGVNTFTQKDEKKDAKK